MKNELTKVTAWVTIAKDTENGNGKYRTKEHVPVEGLFYNEEEKKLVLTEKFNGEKYNLGTDESGILTIARNAMWHFGKDENEPIGFSYDNVYAYKSAYDKTLLNVYRIEDAEINGEAGKRYFVKNGIFWKKTENDYGGGVKGRKTYGGLIALKKPNKGVDVFGLRGNDFDGDIVLYNGCFWNSGFSKLNIYENGIYNMTPDRFVLAGNNNLKEITWEEKFASMEDTEDNFSRIGEILGTMERKINVRYNIISNKATYRSFGVNRIKKAWERFVEPLAGKSEIHWTLGEVSGNENNELE